jgi:acetyl esterase/lipase
VALLLQPEAGAPLRLFYGPDPCQFGDLRLPAGAGPHPVVVVIHGGGWQATSDLAYMAPIAADLCRRGVATWNIEFRRVGDPGGGWPGTLHDVGQAVDFLREIGPRYGLDLARVVTLGHSTGGHLALWLAARPKLAAGPDMARALAGESPLALAGAVNLAGTVDVAWHWAMKTAPGRNNTAAKFLGGSPLEVPERYTLASPQLLLPLGVAQVLAHGGADSMVPLAQSQAYLEKARALGERVELVVVPGVDHLQIVDPTLPGWEPVAAEVLALMC